MFKIAKEFTFDACHMLDGHAGKCHNLHGHTYRLHVEVTGELIADGSSADMVIDFADLKRLVKQFIIDPFDHAFIYQQRNPNESALAELLTQMQRKVLALPCRTTAEGLSRYIFNQLRHHLPVSQVTLWETPTAYCQYSGDH